MKTGADNEDKPKGESIHFQDRQLCKNVFCLLLENRSSLNGKNWIPLIYRKINRKSQKLSLLAKNLPSL